ncbi:unnamed protein product, partial [Vitis vinifera]|uniref:Uncharacterized protein n=1 Tax=Vitis vinifera TaxID=29760 RepID=D7SXL4_VITVI
MEGNIVTRYKLGLEIPRKGFFHWEKKPPASYYNSLLSLN